MYETQNEDHRVCRKKSIPLQFITVPENAWNHVNHFGEAGVLFYILVQFKTYQYISNICLWNEIVGRFKLLSQKFCQDGQEVIGRRAVASFFYSLLFSSAVSGHKFCS